MLWIKTSQFTFTPPEGLPLAGYGGPARRSTSIAGPLTANLMLLGDDQGPVVLIASVDTLFVSQSLLEDLKRVSGGSELLVFATHTHNAPSLAHELPLTAPVIASFYTDFVARFGVAVETLTGSAALPVRVKSSEIATTLNTNRRRRALVLDYPALRRGRVSFGARTVLAPAPRGPIDRSVRVMSFDDPGGKPRAVLWSFAAHPAFYPESLAVCADFPGAVREDLRASVGDECVILYLPGLAGSAIPRAPWTAPRSVRALIGRLLPFHPMLPTFSKRTYRQWTAQLAAAARAAMESRSPIDGGQRVSLRRSTAKGVLFDGAAGLDLAVSSVSFGGGHGILAFSAEMLGEWRSRLVDLCGPKMILTGYAGGPPMYVPPAELLGEGGYEVEEFKPLFGIRGDFRADLNQEIEAAVRQVVS